MLNKTEYRFLDHPRTQNFGVFIGFLLFLGTMVAAIIVGVPTVHRSGPSRAEVTFTLCARMPNEQYVGCTAFVRDALDQGYSIREIARFLGYDDAPQAPTKNEGSSL